MLGSITIGLHHKLCHTLGGSFDLPHAEVHAVILPHALAYNAPAAAPRRWRAIARALGAAATRRPARLFDLGRRARRADLAARRSACAPTTSTAPPSSPLQNPYPNPRPLERAAIRELLQRAFDGARPD